MKILALAAALAGLSVAPAWADPPPAAAPPYRAGVSLQPVALYDKDGNVIGVLTGSVTPAGTSGGQAQAVQGITGGVPLPIQGGKRHGGADRRLGDDAAGQCRGAAAAGGRRHRCEPGDGDRLPRGHRPAGRDLHRCHRGRGGGQRHLHRGGARPRRGRPPMPG